MGFIMLPMVLPEIIIGVSLLVVIIQLGFELSLWSIIMGHILICTPFCIAILSSAFMNLDQNLEEASIDLGQTRWNTFRLVILPLVFIGSPMPCLFIRIALAGWPRLRFSPWPG